MKNKTTKLEKIVIGSIVVGLVSPITMGMYEGYTGQQIVKGEPGLLAPIISTAGIGIPLMGDRDVKGLFAVPFSYGVITYIVGCAMGQGARTFLN